MDQAEFRTWTLRDPFKEFTIVLKDGQRYHVYAPYLALARQSFVLVGIPDPGHKYPFAAETAEVRYADMERIEDLTGPTWDAVRGSAGGAA